MCIYKIFIRGCGRINYMSDNDPWKSNKIDSKSSDLPEKPKIKTIYLHIIVITISVVAFMFGNDIGSGTMPKIKDPSSPILVLFRDLMTGVFFAYLPYIILGWTKKSRSVAIYACLVWVLLYAYAKFLA